MKSAVLYNVRVALTLYNRRNGNVVYCVRELCLLSVRERKKSNDALSQRRAAAL